MFKRTSYFYKNKTLSETAWRKALGTHIWVGDGYYTNKGILLFGPSPYPLKTDSEPQPLETGSVETIERTFSPETYGKVEPVEYRQKISSSVNFVRFNSDDYIQADYYKAILTHSYNLIQNGNWNISQDWQWVAHTGNFHKPIFLRHKDRLIACVGYSKYNMTRKHEEPREVKLNPIQEVSSEIA